MRKRFLIGVLCGLILGVAGSMCVHRMTSYPGPIVARPIIVQPASVVSPNVPKDAGRLQFNGREYYVIPLSDDVQKPS